jgi:hypothetical protein
MRNVTSKGQHLLNLIIEIKKFVIGKTNSLTINLNVDGRTIVVAATSLKRGGHAKSKLLRDNKSIA